MESVLSELPALLYQAGVDTGPELRRHLALAPPSNVSSHGAHTDYYDAELAGLVAQRDRAVIERFGYRYAG